MASDYDKIFKTINQELTKDGNYPKYLKRQLQTGLNKLSNEIGKFYERTYDYSNDLDKAVENYRIENELSIRDCYIDRKTGYLPQAYGVPDDLRKAYSSYYSIRKNWLTTERRESIRKLYQMLNSIDNADKKELAQEISTVYSLINSNSFNNDIKDVTQLYKNKEEYGLSTDLDKNLKEMRQPFKKLNNNLVKLNNKYDLEVDFDNMVLY